MKVATPMWSSQLAYRLAGPLAVVLALGVLAVSELSYRANAELMTRRDNAFEVRVTVSRVLRMLLVMESAQRGYMLSGRPEYRAPYHDAQIDAERVLRSVREVAERLPAHRANLLRLVEVTQNKLSELAEVMRLFETGERERALQLMLTDIGREQMERISQLVEQVGQEEEAAFVRAGVQRNRVRVWTVIALALLALLCLIAALAAVRLTREGENERMRHLEDLQAERDKLEGEVARRTHDLSALAQHLQNVREDERRHLARELHDELGGLLTAAKLDMARVRKRLAGAPPEVVERIDHLGQMLDGGIALKRRIIEDLSPSSLSNLGLHRTLEMHCAEFGKRAEVQVQTSIAEVPGLSEDRELAVFRFVQEALTNIAKYARAKHVQVSLAPDGDEHVCVQVRDDGVGFDTEATTRNGAHGLAGMRFRVQSCGGEWLLRSQPGAGTLVQARLPV